VLLGEILSRDTHRRVNVMIYQSSPQRILQLRHIHAINSSASQSSLLVKLGSDNAKKQSGPRLPTGLQSAAHLHVRGNKPAQAQALSVVDNQIIDQTISLVHCLLPNHAASPFLCWIAAW